MSDHDYRHRIHTTGKYKAIFDGTKKFIDERLGHDVLLLDDLCSQKGWSRRSVQRSLSWFNTSWRQLLWHRRMLEASQLLRGTDLSIKVIARKVGYRNPSHFSKAFKATSGVSPTDYREERRNNG